MVGVGHWVRSVLPRRGGLVGCLSHDSTEAQALALQTAFSERKGSQPIAVVDLGQEFRPETAEKVGIRQCELYLAQPRDIVEAFGMSGALVRSGSFGAVVLDAAVPIAEACEGDLPEWGSAEDEAVKGLVRLTRTSPTPCILAALCSERPGVVFELPAGRRGMRTLRRAFRRTVWKEGGQ